MAEGKPPPNGIGTDWHLDRIDSATPRSLGTATHKTDPKTAKQQNLGCAYVLLAYWEKRERGLCGRNRSNSTPASCQ